MKQLNHILPRLSVAMIKLKYIDKYIKKYSILKTGIGRCFCHNSYVPGIDPKSSQPISRQSATNPIPLEPPC